MVEIAAIKASEHAGVPGPRAIFTHFKLERRPAKWCAARRLNSLPLREMLKVVWFRKTIAASL